MAVAQRLAARTASVQRWRGGELQAAERTLPQETAVALIHDAVTTAVMMATPVDLEDLAVGFSLSEGAISRLEDIRDLEIVASDDGIEARIWLAPDCSHVMAHRRRTFAAPTGCGLCGVESLAAAARALPTAPIGSGITPSQVLAAVRQMAELQQLGAATRAVHAAGLWSPGGGVRLLREDVGRHNALDKLAGAALRLGLDASGGAIVLTSRVSIEMVQKAAMTGAPILIAVSAPTALAVDTAEACGITLVAVAREDGFEVFTHPQRLRT